MEGISLMKLQTQRTLHGFSLIIGCLLLPLLLSACDLGGGSSATATPKPKPSPTPVFTTYKGDGYSIGYPQGWTAKGSGNLVTFSDVLGLTAFIVEEVPNPNSTIPVTSAINGGLNGFQGQSKNFQKVNVAPTVTLNGETWNQGAATGDTTNNGQTVNLKIFILSDNHPANSVDTKTFNLIYSTTTVGFDLVDKQSFQPMLQSFKFA
jgi:hypothetical protein